MKNDVKCKKFTIKNQVQTLENISKRVSNIASKLSHTLSDNEIMALNYELDQHIPYTLITIPSTPNLSYLPKYSMRYFPYTRAKPGTC